MQYNNVAFVFPGQGSQSLGMLMDLAETHPEVEKTFESASQIISTDLWKIVKEGPVEQLNQTENTQPLMLVSGVAVWRERCKSSELRPGWMAGHSLGEISALVCADALSFDDAILLVRERARLMQEAVPSGMGAMAAIIGMDDPDVVTLCKDLAGEKIVAPVNFNAPGQVVIAGHADAVGQAITAAKDKGARRAMLLPVSVPSHCELMEPAAEQFALRLKTVELRSPEIPVIHNVDVASHAAPEVIRSVLAKQLYSPVRWVDTITFMRDQGVNTIVECGPGKVLSGLNKRIVKTCDALAITDNNTMQKALEFFE